MPQNNMTADPVILEAVREAWNAGYQTCIDTLRGLKDEISNEEMWKVIDQFADTLQDLKP